MGKNIMHEDHLEEWKRDRIDAKVEARRRLHNLCECEGCGQEVNRDETHLCESEECFGRFCEDCATMDDDGLWWCEAHRKEEPNP